MSQEFNTLELAGIYENQGYFQDAFEMYQALARETGKKDGSDPEINAGLRRMEAAMQNQASKPKKIQDPLTEKRIKHLLEQWLMLMVLQKKLNLIKQIQSRV